MKRQLANIPDSDDELVYLDEAIHSCEDCRIRLAMDPGPGYFRAITPERNEGINQFYLQTAQTMYKGFATRMEKYAASDNIQQQKVAAIFSEVQK
jgi:hypothetical protein